MGWTLGPEVTVPLPHSAGFFMRIADDLRKSVVFFGYADPKKAAGMVCIGTGFLLGYKGVAYLVTAKHLSHELGSDPFWLRINNKDGKSATNLHADGVKWFEHSDPLVDVSLVDLHIGTESHLEAVYLDGDDMLVTPEMMTEENIGVGNFTYTIGLFRLLTGEKRNLPVCHLGSIALLPGDERVPVIDWTDPDRQRRISVEAYLIEAQSLAGLSGSPVFVRAEHDMDFKGMLKRSDGVPGEPPHITGCRTQLRLLGLWQGAWQARSDEVLAAEANAPVVPVGMGVVVPSTKIIELLERDDVKAHREKLIAKSKPPAAQPQALPMPKKGAEADAATTRQADDPGHRERFNRLLGAAVKPPKSSD